MYSLNIAFARVIKVIRSKASFTFSSGHAVSRPGALEERPSLAWQSTLPPSLYAWRITPDAFYAVRSLILCLSDSINSWPVAWNSVELIAIAAAAVHYYRSRNQTFSEAGGFTEIPFIASSAVSPRAVSIALYHRNPRVGSHATSYVEAAIQADYWPWRYRYRSWIFSINDFIPGPFLRAKFLTSSSLKFFCCE